MFFCNSTIILNDNMAYLIWYAWFKFLYTTANSKIYFKKLPYLP